MKKQADRKKLTNEPLEISYRISIITTCNQTLLNQENKLDLQGNSAQLTI